jgi:hypothetical protein
MLDHLPRRTFFRFELPVPYVAKAPPLDGRIHKWTVEYLVPPLVSLEGGHPLADVYWAWNEDGFYVALDVPRGPTAPQCDPNTWWKSDGLRLCIDTRDARDMKRGTRFCHFFYALPLGGGRSGRHPAIGFHRLSHARESPPQPDLTRIRAVAAFSKTGYALELAIPADCLHGWDPAEHPRIGLFYKVKDSRLGTQTLSADDELGWNVDPSTWASGVLVRAAKD